MLISQVDGRDQVFACAAYTIMIFMFLGYAAFLFARPLQQRQNPPLSASYVEDLTMPELATFPYLVSGGGMLYC